MTPDEILRSKFRLGEVLVTTPLHEHCEKNNFSLLPYLIRHSQCDWGDLCQEDKESNNYALENGERLLSAYKLRDGEKIWIITEWDRSVTTILFPSDY